METYRSKTIQTETTDTPDRYKSYIERHKITPDLPLPAPHVGLSIVIPALNEEELIEETLERFNNQTNQNFEVIIIDNGSTDRTQEIVCAFAKTKAEYALYVLEEQEPGIGHARKRGMDQSPVRGSRIKYIAGMDADTLVPPDWTESIYQTFAQTNADFLAGDVRYGLEDIVGYHPLSFVDKARAALGKHIMPLVRGCNFAVKTDMYVAADGISQPYTQSGERAPGEEATLSRAVLQLKGKLSHLPVAVIPDSRRQLATLLAENESMYGAGGTMTDIRNSQDLKEAAKGLSVESLEKLKEDSLKRLFKRYLRRIYIRPLYRELYWEKAKQLVSPHEEEIEADMLIHSDDIEYLWKKYKDAYLGNLTNLVEEGL